MAFHGALCQTMVRNSLHNVWITSEAIPTMHKQMGKQNEQWEVKTNKIFSSKSDSSTLLALLILFYSFAGFYSGVHRCVTGQDT